MSGIRFGQEDKTIISRVQEKTGITTASGVVKLGLKALAAQYQTGSFLAIQGFGDAGRQMLVDSLDGAGQVRPLESLAIGSVVIFPPASGTLYRLGGKYQQADMQLRCILRPIEPGGKVHHVDDGTLCEVIGRLDERLPMSLLQIDDFQTKVLLALAPGGALATEDLYRRAMHYPGRDTSKMRVSRAQLGPFIGRLLAGLCAAVLIEFSGNNPLEAAWSLTGRGQELCRHLHLDGGGL